MCLLLFFFLWNGMHTFSLFFVGKYSYNYLLCFVDKMQTVIGNILILFIAIVAIHHCIFTAYGNIIILQDAPNRPARSEFTFEWCDCSKGLLNITLWGQDPSEIIDNNMANVNKSNHPITLTSFNNEPIWMDMQVPTNIIYDF